MKQELRAFGYLCPACGKQVIASRTPFALQASAVAVVCDCGKSELTAENDGKFFRITVPCGICGEEHRAEVPASAVLNGDGIGLTCPDVRQMCCYLGAPHRVEQGIAELALAVEKRKALGDEPFVDSVIMFEVLSELRDMLSRDAISCSCGHKGCSMDILGTAVELLCPDCGGRMRVPAATDEDLDQLCCHMKLTIKGRASL